MIDLATNSRGTIGRVLRLFVCAILAGSICGCGPFGVAQAERGLDGIMDELPEPQAFTVVAVEHYSGSRRFGDVTCHIAEAIVAMGTELPEDVALEHYAQALVERDWVPERSLDLWDRAGRLRWRDHGKISMDTASAGPLISENEDYREAVDDYPTWVHLSVQYLLPSASICLDN